MHAYLLPWFGQSQFFEVINFDISDIESANCTLEMNRTARQTVLGQFLRPLRNHVERGNSYRLNLGLSGQQGGDSQGSHGSVDLTVGRICGVQTSL